MKTKKAKVKAKVVAMSMTALAAQAALADIRAEYGENTIVMDNGRYALEYTYDPFDGMLA